MADNQTTDGAADLAAALLQKGIAIRDQGRCRHKAAREFDLLISKFADIEEFSDLVATARLNRNLCNV